MATLDRESGEIDEARLNRIVDQLLVKLPNASRGLALVVESGADRQLRIFPRAGHAVENYSDIAMLWWYKLTVGQYGELKTSDRLGKDEVMKYLTVIKSIQ